MKFEVRIQAESSRAFQRGRAANEISSDPVVAAAAAAAGAAVTPTGGYRTTQQLREDAQMKQIVDMAGAVDHKKSISIMWACNEDRCDNYLGRCYRHPDGSHFPIKAADCQSWAKAVLRGNCTINLPDEAILGALRLNGNKLKVNPHNKRRRGESSSSADGEAAFKKMERELRRQRLRDEMEKMEDRRERREELKKRENLRAS
jgi:hypothetical protein